MAKINVASSGFTPVQVGRIVDPAEDEQDEPTPPKGKRAPGKTVNVRSGNAKVGRQADVIVGDLNIRM